MEEIVKGLIFTGLFTLPFLLLIAIFLLYHYYDLLFHPHRHGDGQNLESQEPTSGPTHQGVSPSVLKALPVAIIRPEEFKKGDNCAICLCELAEMQKVRMLPTCSHLFHVKCIDNWLQTHGTCPLCRRAVVSTIPNSNV